MSSFDVKIRKVDSIDTHPNADALDLAVIGGYRSVVKRNEFKPGDLVLYIPDDCLFNDLTIAERLGIASYLIGKGKNRVKPIRLRGELSQGIVVPIGKLSSIDAFISNLGTVWKFSENEDIAEYLKVEKYEEPIPIQMAGKIRPWAAFIPKYDVENIKRPESMAAMIEAEEVVVTEKLHGTNTTVAYDGEKTYVCSRNNSLQYDLENVYWRVAKKYGLGDKIRKYWHAFSRAQKARIALYESPTTISLHGEIVGVQDLKYGHNGGDCGFYAFDIMMNGKFLSPADFQIVCLYFNIPTVPTLYTGPYNYDSLKKLANGKTELADGCHIREGIVVKPVEDRYDPDAGRVQFKFINEEYLVRKGGTEMH